MIEKQNIIYVGNDWFTENKTSSHHIAELLSKNNRILYIEGAGQRSPKFSRRDLSKLMRKVKKISLKPTQLNKNFMVFSPILIPLHKYRIFRTLNSLLLKFQINALCAKQKFSDPLLWVFQPHYHALVENLKSKGTIYYCVDEYSAQPGVDSASILKMENKLIKNADIVFTVSEKLYNKKRGMNPNTYLSLHGVDVQHFNPLSNTHFKYPKDISNLSRPIIGFFGLIQPRVDLKLIKFLAEERPQYEFVLIGLVAQNITFLTSAKNVHFLGTRNYQELPNYLSAFDVAIMPYRLDEEMINSNPIKTREYLAGGKPVVSVRIKEVEKYQPLVFIADTKEEFLLYIDEAIKFDSEGKRAERMLAMEKESWEYRLETISKIIQNHISL
jgi:glycosyltransferase involved in cell wall biosynthesis